MRRSALPAVLAACALVAAPAHAQQRTAAAAAAPPATAPKRPAPPPPVPSTVVFTNQGELFALAIDGPEGKKAMPQSLGPVPEEIGPVTAVTATLGGKLVVLQGERGAAWRAEGATRWSTGCSGRALAAPAGDAVLCEATGKAGETTIIDVSTGGRTVLPGELRDANFRRGPSDVGILTDDGVFGFAVATPKKRKRLSKAGATGQLLIAPDGTTAVAVFGKGATSRIYTFALDGEGTPRRLGGPGLPVVWSWDSQWVLIEEGAAPPAEGGDGDENGDGEGDGEGGSDDGAEGAWLPIPRPWQGVGVAPPVWLLAKDAAKKPAAPAAKKKAPAASAAKKGKKGKKRDVAVAPEDNKPIKVRTCVARVAGGETKCWNGWSARAFAPDNERVLVFRDGHLGIGKIAGVRPEPPRTLVGADGPAAWY